MAKVVAEFLADMKSVNKADSLSGLLAERIEPGLCPENPELLPGAPEGADSRRRLLADDREGSASSGTTSLAGWSTCATWVLPGIDDPVLAARRSMRITGFTTSSGRRPEALGVAAAPGGARRRDGARGHALRPLAEPVDLPAPGAPHPAEGLHGQLQLNPTSPTTPTAAWWMPATPISSRGTT